MKVVCAYKYALDPNSSAELALYAHCGAARFAFNHMLAHVKAVHDQRAAEQSYGLAGDELTPAANWTAYGLRKVWNQREHQVAVAADTGEPWWSAYSKEAYSSGLANLAAALEELACFPYRETRRSRDGFSEVQAPQGRRGGVGTVHHRHDPPRRARPRLCSPVIGRVTTHESTRKLARRVEAGTARIMAATIKRERGRWFAVFTCAVERDDPSARNPSAAVGVDVGVKTLAVTSDGTEYANSKYLATSLTRLRRESRRVSRRRGPDRRTGNTGSARWHRANRARNRVHHRAPDARRDGPHKLTTELAATYGAIAVEDLNVAGMLRNRRLARAIADTGFATPRHQLAYKTQWRGSVFAVADRWYPSSKTCSDCKAVKSKLFLSERVFVCEECGLVRNRDHNAALNLADQVAILFPEWPGEAKRGRGGDVRPAQRAAADETSTRRPPTSGTGTSRRKQRDHRESLILR